MIDFGKPRLSKDSDLTSNQVLDIKQMKINIVDKKHQKLMNYKTVKD